MLHVILNHANPVFNNQSFLFFVNLTTHILSNVTMTKSKNSKTTKSDENLSMSFYQFKTNENIFGHDNETEESKC